MTNTAAKEKRDQMLTEGYCVIPDILPKEFINELREETERINNTTEHHPDTKYQGTHVDVQYAENEVMDRLSKWQPARSALDDLGFSDFMPGDGMLVLTKEPFGPALYWHQDWTQWTDPLSLSPWPQRVFVSYYLEETTKENGCLKLIPGSHLKRITLHDEMVTAHELGARFINEDHPVMFSDHPDQVEVESTPGTLVIVDARVLHSAYKNNSANRRNLLLLWHFRPPAIPTSWTGSVPVEISERDPDVEYERSRVPGKYLRA